VAARPRLQILAGLEASQIAAIEGVAGTAAEIEGDARLDQAQAVRQAQHRQPEIALQGDEAHRVATLILVEQLAGALPGHQLPVAAHLPEQC
jgi:hypothetical protein